MFTQPIAAPREPSPVRQPSPPPVQREPSPVRAPTPPPVREPSPVTEPSPPPSQPQPVAQARAPSDPYAGKGVSYTQRL